MDVRFCAIFVCSIVRIHYAYTLAYTLWTCVKKFVDFIARAGFPVVKYGFFRVTVRTAHPTYFGDLTVVKRVKRQTSLSRFIELRCEYYRTGFFGFKLRQTRSQSHENVLSPDVLSDVNPIHSLHRRKCKGSVTWAFSSCRTKGALGTTFFPLISMLKPSFSPSLLSPGYANEASRL